jgi:hypothetical protein
MRKIASQRSVIGRTAFAPAWKILILCLLAQGVVLAQSGLLKTNFFRGPALTAEELDSVVQLAKQCGLSTPEAVADMGVLPNLRSVPRTLVVAGAERVEGRSASQVWLCIGCTNWSPSSAGPNVRKVGPFYVESPYLHTNRATLFRFGTNTARMSISGDISLETADAIVGCFVRRQVRLSPDVQLSDWESVDVSQPTSLVRPARSNDYVIVFGSPPRQTINFRYVNREVVIIWVPGQITY